MGLVHGVANEQKAQNIQQKKLEAWSDSAEFRWINAQQVVSGSIAECPWIGKALAGQATSQLELRSECRS